MKIKIANLKLNTENPRFELVSSQREAISTMIADQKSKLEKLANHIINNGVNPSDIVMVTKDPKAKGKYIVLEGNRRITTLKLLNNPNLINEKHKSTLNKFKNLSKSFKQNPITQIECAVFENEEEANKWIKLKHTGENEGIGTVTWDTHQKRRFDERFGGKTSYALQLIDFLGKSSEFSGTLKNKLPDVPETSLQRLIGDPDIRKVIGIEIKEGKVISSISSDEIVKPMAKIVRDLTSKSFKVKEIYSKSDRLNYIETFKKSDLPDTTSNVGDWEITTTKPPKKKAAAKKKKSKPLSTDRKSVIPKSCVIPISKPRINKIYRELKDLDLGYYENAGAILLRVFIELSVDTYFEKYKLKIAGKETLAKKLASVSQDMITKKLITKYEVKPINTAASNPNSVLSINTFNAYVHNKHFSPIPKDIKTAWDGFEHFTIKLWENV